MSCQLLCRLTRGIYSCMILQDALIPFLELLLTTFMCNWRALLGIFFSAVAMGIGWVKIIYLSCMILQSVITVIVPILRALPYANCLQRHGEKRYDNERVHEIEYLVSYSLKTYAITSLQAYTVLTPIFVLSSIIYSFSSIPMCLVREGWWPTQVKAIWRNLAYPFKSLLIRVLNKNPMLSSQSWRMQNYQWQGEQPYWMACKANKSTKK